MQVQLLLSAQHEFPEEHNVPAQHNINMQDATGQTTCEEEKGTGNIVSETS